MRELAQMDLLAGRLVIASVELGLEDRRGCMRVGLCDG